MLPLKTARPPSLMDSSVRSGNAAGGQAGAPPGFERFADGRAMTEGIGTSGTDPRHAPTSEAHGFSLCTSPGRTWHDLAKMIAMHLKNTTRGLATFAEDRLAHSGSQVRR